MSAAAAITQPEIRLRFESLPAEYTARGSKSLGAFLMVFPCVWGGAPTAIVIWSLARGTLEPGMLPLLLFTAVGLALFLFGLNQFFYEERVVLSRKEIRFTRKSLFGTRTWCEPTRSFQGILRRTVRRSRSHSRYTVYLLELVHPDKDKTVTIYRSTSGEGFRQRQEEACRALGLPALEESSEGLISRSVEDLHKSVGELVRESKLAVDFDPSAPVPEGLSLSTDPESDTLTITFTQRRFPLLGALIGLGFPAAFIYLGFRVDEVPVVFGVLGCLFAAVVVLGMVWSHLATVQLRIRPSGLELLVATPWGSFPLKKIEASDVKAVKIGRSRRAAQGLVVVTGDDETMCVSGVSREALNWLRGCILAVLSRGVPQAENLKR